uniref:Sporangia induced dynein heavy chain putative n=1 Tax=Albugo laibachii Nc14 TaxID=890382 RepID=F0WJ27_9STRA|nr:sporangia induced dynein heavy chain putative [Albugo laibachii Nc14]CCA21647.1 sporangia induced dynein heavy chain putative [Albugo laibachii Nc14]|eukprot:CCA21647.1 sporangia induced dynein heavy chain putative [Albugo laibachii Nc14]
MCEKEREYQRPSVRTFLGASWKRDSPNSVAHKGNQIERLHDQTSTNGGECATSIIKCDVPWVTFAYNNVESSINESTSNKVALLKTLKSQSIGKLKGSALVNWLVKNSPRECLYYEANDSKAKDEGKWSTSHFLPLHYFISIDRQAYELEYLVLNNGPLDAVALPMMSVSGNPGKWSTCKVISIAKKSRFFVVSWAGGTRVGKPLVPESLVCFEKDDPVKFIGNLHEAIQRRKIAEGSLRYIHLISTIPLSGDPPLSQHTINRILSLALGDHERRQRRIWDRSTTTALIEEISSDYSLLTKKLLFESMEEDSEHEMLTLGSFPTTYSYSSLLSGYDERKAMRWKTKELNRSQLTLLANPSLVATILEVQEACARLVKQTNVIHFYTSEKHNFQTQKRLAVSKMISRVKASKQNEHSSWIMTLEELNLAISRMANAMLRSVRDDRTRKVAKQVHSSLYDAHVPSYDVTQANRLAYMTSNLKRLLTRMDLMIQNAVGEFVLTNFELYTSIVEEIADFDVKIQSLMDVWIHSKKNLNENQSSSCHVCSLFRLEVVVSHEEVQKDSRKVDIDAVSGMKTERLSHMPYGDEKTDSAHDSNSPTIRRRPKLTFEYETNPYDFLHAFLSIFGTALSHLESLDLLERLVMDRIFWPTQCYIQCPGIECTSIQLFRDRIRNAISSAIAPTEKYLELLEVYVPLLNLNAEDYVQSILFKTEEIKKEGPLDEIATPFDCDHYRSLVMSDVAEVTRLLRYHRLLEENVQREIPESTVCIGLYEIDVFNMKTLLAKKHQDIILRLLEAHASNTNEAARKLLAKFEDIYSRLSIRPKDIEDVNQLQEYLSSVQQMLVPLIENVQEVARNSKVFGEFQYTLCDDDLRTIWLVQAWPQKIVKTMNLSRDWLEERL